ncbi:hypothetical protein U1Q18_018890 [Sarracenia purpurea var. burkii]
MAEEVQYASVTDSASNKRKYDEQTTPPASGGARRTTGFSAPITSKSPDSGNAPPSYNSVPPPVDDFQLAKQRAQEIAARLFNSAEAKRPRVENGGAGSDSSDNAGQKFLISNASPSSVSYGYPGASKKIGIPNGRVGVIIGKGGETIKYLQLQSGAKIQVTRDMDADPNSPTRMVELTGTPDQIAKAEQLIHEVLSEAEAGGSGRVTGQPSGSEQFVMKVPNNRVGLVIGKGGETIKNMQARSGARIQVIPLHLPPGDTSTERTVQIDGTSEQVEAAKQLVNEVTSENRHRNPAMAGGYPQQGYQARPPTSWAPPGLPMQQPGYGYMQPGAYPTPSPQYPGYPQPTSAGWDQTTGAPYQQPSQGGSYEYYSQQTQQQQAPADNASSYGYSQPPASGYNPQGQGYSQDGYGGYQAPAPQPGYDNPQPNPVQGYDQQQGYSSTPGYGNVANPTPEGQTPSYGGVQGDTSVAPPPVQSSAMGQHGYNTTQQPSPNPNPASYPPQGSSQTGYGVPTSQPGYGTQPPSGYAPSYGPPQAQKPSTNQSAYGQPQQSPSAQGGYVQPAPMQPGYPHSQPPPAQAGYAQAGTATAQPGYGNPPYGAPPVTQPGYGQQPPPPYNNSYGGGYSQPPGYSADGNAGGNARGTYDAAPTSQAVQPSRVAKASPQT